MTTNTRFDWQTAVKFGLLGGAVAIYISLVGLAETFSDRDVISQTLSLGRIFLFIMFLFSGYLAGQRGAHGGPLGVLASGLLAGVLSSAMLGLLAASAVPFNLRAVLLNASPTLVGLLTFDQAEIWRGVAILVGLGGALGLVGALIDILPPAVRRSFLWGLAMVVLVGTLGELLAGILSGPATTKPLAKSLFTRGSLSITSAIFIFVLAAVVTYWKPARRPLTWGVGAMLLLDPIASLLKLDLIRTPTATSVVFVAVTGLNVLWHRRGQQATTLVPAPVRRGMRYSPLIVMGLILGFLPAILGLYLSEVTNTVGIFILMGLGLNIVVGFAGLLDLGYVAFFAIGAYTMGLLTSVGDLGIAQMSFWVALPISMAVSVFFGVLLGIPVLRMRGDYLAIVTLGFGEIIRILALSDFLRPFIGGAQGILSIPKPTAGPLEFVSPQQLYYVILAGCLVAAFIAWRLRESRTGRSWMAMREDEDVAEAMGINLVKTKLLAFAVGAGFSGLSGAIFAAKIGSIFPHSFNLLISINALSLIIVGGIGSLPGVVVGSLVLVGLPELLREFAEFRLLIYGALLVMMMLVRPEGLWPEATRKRELHAHEEFEPAPAAQTS